MENDLVVRINENLSVSLRTGERAVQHDDAAGGVVLPVPGVIEHELNRGLARTLQFQLAETFSESLQLEAEDLREFLRPITEAIGDILRVEERRTNLHALQVGVVRAVRRRSVPRVGEHLAQDLTQLRDALKALVRQPRCDRCSGADSHTDSLRS